MIVFYHNDNDGRCAAAIASRWFLARWPDAPDEDLLVETVAVDYKTPFPVGLIRPGTKETVAIVDFSPKPADMEKIRRRVDSEENIIWIDHHKTAASYPYAADRIRGLRDFTDKGSAGCELAWEFFFGSKVVPIVVFLLGDYDSWRLTEAPRCLAVNEGVKATPDSRDPKSWFWKEVLDSHDNRVANTLAEKGRMCIAYRDAYCGGMAESHGYETVICGHKAFAMNVYGFGSQAFGRRVNEYPVLIAYIHDGRRFTVSLYSTTVDVSECAKAHGGGGHKGAAGFVCDRLPFLPKDTQ